jgi:predicted enzyme related to lactoylglutathione lyase
MGAPVVHFEITAKDAPALRAFYRDAFGWNIGDRVAGAGIPDYTIVETSSGAGIAGGIGAAPEGYDGHVTFYIQVPDVALALEAVERRGGTKMMGPSEVPGGPVIGLFEDPEGHVIGLVRNAPA